MCLRADVPDDGLAVPGHNGRRLAVNTHQTGAFTELCRCTLARQCHATDDAGNCQQTHVISTESTHGVQTPIKQ